MKENNKKIKKPENFKNISLYKVCTKIVNKYKIKH